MAKIIFFLSSLCLTTLSISQVVNIENKRINDGSYGLSGLFDMSFSTFQQDDLLLTFTFKPFIQYKFGRPPKKNFFLNDSILNIASDQPEAEKPPKNKHLLLLINDLKYAASKEELFANFGMSHLRYAYRIKNSILKWEAYAQIQYNELLLEHVRVLLGSGLRVKVIDNTRKASAKSDNYALCFLGSSVFGEYQEINHAERSMEYINTVRWNTYLSTYFHFKTVEISSSTYFQPNITDFTDCRILGDYSFLFRVSDPFSVKINISYFYDSKPAPTVASTILSTSIGFTYRLNSTK